MQLWHRRLGLLALVLIVVLALTGIALNHTEALRLDQRTIENDVLLDWYGLNPRNQPRTFPAGGHRITQWDEQLFFDQTPLIISDQALKGAVEFNGMIVGALQRSILLLNQQGELIERITLMDNMVPIHRIGTNPDRLVVLSENRTLFAADTQVIEWETVEFESIRWSQAETTPTDLQDELKTVYRGEGLSLERVLLDLHSGRLFSAQWGVYIMDASALILLWLGLSGFWVWHSRKRKLKTKKHYQKHHRL
jgi:hypothetical protein